MWIVMSAQVTEISTPGTKRMPSVRAASAAWASPASSSWSVSASTVTPFAAARRTISAGASVPSEIVEWQWRSKLQVSSAPIVLSLTPGSPGSDASIGYESKNSSIADARRSGWS